MRNSSPYSLIDNSLAVATATDSSWIDPFTRNKPVLMFGKRFYQFAPGIYKIQKGLTLHLFLIILKPMLI